MLTTTTGLTSSRSTAIHCISRSAFDVFEVSLNLVSENLIPSFTKHARPPPLLGGLCTFPLLLLPLFVHPLSSLVTV